MEYKNLIELIATVSKSNLTEFHYEEGDTKVVMSAGVSEDQVAVTKAPVEVQKVVTQEVQEPAAVEENIVKSPLVGTFYLTPSEDAEPFVAVGDKVKKGQVLAIVEAMKLMNDIESEFDGEIVEIYLESGKMVEYGQPLFRIA